MGLPVNLDEKFRKTDFEILAQHKGNAATFVVRLNRRRRSADRKAIALCGRFAPGSVPIVRRRVRSRTEFRVKRIRAFVTLGYVEHFFPSFFSLLFSSMFICLFFRSTGFVLKQILRFYVSYSYVTVQYRTIRYSTVLFSTIQLWFIPLPFLFVFFY